MDLLYAHELAMIDFAKLEFAGNPDPGAPLDDFLARFGKYPAT